MNVADLRQHLSDLAKLLSSIGGASGVAKDVAAFAHALEPFDRQSTVEFTRFLVKAHEYDTTGKLTPPKAARAPRVAKPKADPAEVARTLRAVYDRGGDLSLSMEQIETALAQLDGLQKAGLLAVCDALELVGMKNKTMPDLLAAIRQRIHDLRGAAQRGAMIESESL